jgi:transcriptional regulator with XRE-family HTH domain
MKTEGDIAAIRYNLGNRIRLMRDEQDLTQHAFSKMVEINRSYLVDVEHGKRNVSIDNLCKISRGLGISLSELCEGTDDREAINERLELMRQMMEEAEQAEADESGAEEA